MDNVETVSVNDEKKKLLTLARVLELMELRFTSGNGILVSRAAIRPEEWALVKAAIRSKQP